MPKVFASVLLVNFPLATRVRSRFEPLLRVMLTVYPSGLSARQRVEVSTRFASRVRDHGGVLAKQSKFARTPPPCGSWHAPLGVLREQLGAQLDLVERVTNRLLDNGDLLSRDAIGIVAATEVEHHVADAAAVDLGGELALGDVCIRDGLGVGDGQLDSVIDAD